MIGPHAMHAMHSTLQFLLKICSILVSAVMLRRELPVSVYTCRFPPGTALQHEEGQQLEQMQLRAHLYLDMQPAPFG